MKTKEKKTINNALLNMISPIGFICHKNKLEIGENTAKCYALACSL